MKGLFRSVFLTLFVLALSVNAALAATVYMIPPAGAPASTQFNQSDGTLVNQNANGTYSVTDPTTVNTNLRNGWQVVHGGATPPTSGTCTGNTISGWDTAFQSTAATGASCVMTWIVPFTVTPTTCLCTDSSASAAVVRCVPTTTGATITLTTGHAFGCNLTGY